MPDVPLSSAKVELMADNRQEPGVFPWFQDEIPGATAEGLDGQLRGTRRGHDHRGGGVSQGLETLKEVKTLLAGGGVATVVEVHQEHIRLTLVEGCHDGVG